MLTAFTTVRRLCVVLLTSAALWAALVSITFAAERIDSFTANIEVSGDGTLLVTETIVYDFGTAQRHGIYRDVRPDHAQSASAWYKKRYLEFDLVSVTRDGFPEKYDGSTRNALSVRIGDPNKTITGTHEYEIVYRVYGAIAEYDAGTELYWNVTGDEWEVSMDQVQVLVTPTDGVMLDQRAVCYIGETGSTARCDVNREGDTSIFTGSITAGEQITIAQGLELTAPPQVYERLGMEWVAGAFIFLGLILLVALRKVKYLLFAVYSTFFALAFLGIYSLSDMQLSLHMIVVQNALILLVVVTLLLFVGLAIYRWRTAYKSGGPIIPQYEPYQDFKPMFTGVLYDGTLHGRDITAGIVYLAQQKFIKIRQTTDRFLGLFETHDYEVTLLKPIDDASTTAHRQLLRLLFENISSTKDIDSRPWYVWFSTGYGPDRLSIAPGKTVRLSDIKKDQSKLKYNHKLLQALKKSVQKDLIEFGFIEKRSPEVMVPIWSGSFAVFVLVFLYLPFMAILLAVCGVLMFVLLDQRLTREGYKALNYLEGFKDFLSTTDKERYKFHNAPAKNPEQFMEYLPYAIAFKVEEKWAEVFKDIQIDPPDWYQSDTGQSFSAVNLGHDLGVFSSSLESSGTSGASGGGASGGGSGGGGGGSW